MDAVDGADRLQHDDLRFARRRAVVVDAGGKGGVEENRRAARWPSRVGEVTDLDPWNIGQRSAWRLLRRRLHRTMKRDRRRGSGEPLRCLSNPITSIHSRTSSLCESRQVIYE